MLEPIRVDALSSRGRWEVIPLTPGVAPEDFLQVLCYRPEAAAHFLLRWAQKDEPTAARFLAGLLTRMHEELDLRDASLRARTRSSALDVGRPSVARVAFLRFSELLFESPRFVFAVLNDEAASEQVRTLSTLADRLGNTASITRGLSWAPREYTFENPEPVPHEVVSRYVEEGLIHKIQHQAAHIEALQSDHAEVRREERRRQKGLQQARRRQYSQERKVLRAIFRRLPLAGQIDVLCDFPDVPVKVFPFRPESVTVELLRSLTDRQVRHLEQRCHERWEAPWRALASRIQSLQAPS